VTILNLKGPLIFIIFFSFFRTASLGGSGLSSGFHIKYFSVLFIFCTSALYCNYNYDVVDLKKKKFSGFGSGKDVQGFVG